MHRPSYLQKELARTVLVALLTMLSGIVVLTSRTVETVHAFSSGPPPAVTGAPGDFGTCANCHFGPPPNGQFTISAPQTYVPGQTYQITVTHINNDATRNRWGFELTALSSGVKAGELQNLSAFTQILNNADPNPNRQYIEHSATGTFPGQSGGASWTFNWVAPATNVGAVTFYAAGNQANSDGDTSGDQIYTTQATVTPSTSSATSVQFDRATYSLAEGCAAVIITVSRSGDTSGTTTVDFVTTDGSALQRSDYSIASGTLNFTAGQTSRTFKVLATDDAYVENNETLNVTLSNVTGGSLGSQSTAIVIIADDDTVNPPTTQPIDDTATFVCQHYHDFLSREPDSGGFDFWKGQITQCGSDQACIFNKRLDVSNAFFFELEFQQTGAYVFRLYRVAYGNSQPFPNPSTSNPTEANKLPSYAVFSRDRAKVIGGSSLAAKQADLANLFVARPEFLVKYPASLATAEQFVDAVLANIQTDLGVNLSSQRDALITLYNSGGRGAVMYRLADDNVQTNPINNRSLIDAEYNRAFVATQYFGYLRRNPDIPGFLFWLGQVNSAALRDVPKQHAMVCSFITSTEYQQRFSSFVTHNNAECPQ